MMKLHTGRASTRRAAALVLGCVLVASGAALADEQSEILISVNGDAITAADMDRMIMQTHRTMGESGMEEADNELLGNLLQKAVNDRLILQEAVAMGLHEEEQILSPLQEQRHRHAISLYLDENFQPPTEYSDEEMRDFFGRNYASVDLRQITVPEKQLAQGLADRIRGGESMAELASQFSIDPKRFQGGAHERKFRKDVEESLRPHVEDLPLHEVAGPVPYGDSWALVRVEARHEADPADLEERKETVESQLLAVKRRAAWKDFVARHREKYRVRSNDAVLADMESDAEQVYRGEFLTEDDRAALYVDETHAFTGTELRRKVSHTAMQMGTSTFEEILASAVDKAGEELALMAAADEGGYFNRPEVDARFEQDLEQRLIETYLDETVATRIRFKREEFDAFYAEHADEFRGEDEVRLSFILSDDEETMKAAAARLADGADFGYVRREVQGGDGHGGSESSTWSEVGVFSDTIQSALSGLPVGGTSDVLPFGDTWMILRLDGRREGQVRPMEEVEMAIRQVMFQRKFKELLDEQLSLLKERSEIVRHDERIAAYFRAES